MMIGALLGIAGLIYLVLGTLHVVYTLLDLRDPRRLVPEDPAVLAGMRASKLRIARGEVTTWQAWIGFNLSHSLGALMLGGACLVFAVGLGSFPFPPWVLLALAGLSAVYLLIASSFWFRVPIAGVAAATGCLGAAWLLYVL